VTGGGLWAARAASAERAVHARHVRRVWLLPGTALGVVSWPAGLRHRLFLGGWHYWWQAHLLDCALDANLRDPTPARRAIVERLVRGIRLRNLRRGWTNIFYDDIAWMGLALHRAAATAGIRRDDALTAITRQLRAGWTDSCGGGIWWHVGSDFKNAPANGPAAILFARRAGGDLGLAERTAEWIERQLVDQQSGLVLDGVKLNADGSVRQVERAVFSYCQGVYLGACVELALATDRAVWTQRARRTIAAVRARMTNADGVLHTHGGGDGGLFSGILARYLALAALRLPGRSQPDRIARQTAADLVVNSAAAAWRHRTVAAGGPLFGADWSTPAATPATNGAMPGQPERDLSVQLSGWMLCEAAASIEREAADLL
jgi:predicted alpha-1,6-mannanase (GH76 family)